MEVEPWAIGSTELKEPAARCERWRRELGQCPVFKGHLRVHPWGTAVSAEFPEHHLAGPLLTALGSTQKGQGPWRVSRGPALEESSAFC